jgi:hypothetical protein
MSTNSSNSRKNKDENNKENVNTSNQKRKTSNNTINKEIDKDIINLSKKTKSTNNVDSLSNNSIIAANSLIELSATPSQSNGIKNYYKTFQNENSSDVSQVQSSTLPKTPFGLKANRDLLNFTPPQVLNDFTSSPVTSLLENAAETMTSISSPPAGSDSNTLDDDEVNITMIVRELNETDDQDKDLEEEINFDDRDNVAHESDENTDSNLIGDREYLTPIEKTTFCNYVECLVLFQDKEQHLQQCIIDLHINISTEM